MASNSVVSASIPNASKDLGKKKRANRSAKLKQCKLDARREQWLSHVRNKTCKDERNGMFGGEIHSPSPEPGNKPDLHFEDIETRRRGGENNYHLIHHLDSDSESPLSPTSSASRGNDLGNSFTGGDTSSSSRSCSSSSSFSSGGCCSGSITEEEEEGGGGHHDDDDDDGCLDDWEAVADALAADDDNMQRNSLESEKEAVQLESEKEADKPKLEHVPLGLGEVASTRAWRADDAFRPPSLPSLLKQKSFPLNLEKHSGRGINPWGCNRALSAPSSCPICYEDLDLTDSSFLPCLCGFRLCLFCHKRILEGDGRCPGCRKPYELDAVQKQASDAGGSSAIRLARSCSMFTRA